ncbi:MAG: L-threonylcarbamoyladenylate synthase, partial [Candidatus Baltobacteraceae bacterium]
MPLLSPTRENLALAAGVLREGGVVAFPTETVYGLGARAFDPVAVARIFEVKRRPAFDPLIVHVLDRAMFEEVAIEIPPAAEVLIDRFWPGGLTLVVRKRPRIPSLVTAGLESVAVRMPSHPVARAL